MSVEAFSWALTVPVGGNAKVVLLGLANHAHPDGTESYPALDTLARYAHCDRSTARRNVRKLVADGWAIEDGTGPRGQTKYRLPLNRKPESGGAKSPPSQNATGSAGASQGVAPTPPEPSIEPSNRQKRASGRLKEEQVTVHRLPDDLPEHLHDAAIAAGRVLYRTATARGQHRVVLLEAVGRAVSQRPTKDHVAVAEKVEHWLCWGKGQTKPCDDVVLRFRNFLVDAEDVRLPDGSPLAVPAERGPNVHPIRPPQGQARNANGKPTHAELIGELRAANPRLHPELAVQQLPSGARP
jgi:hypothetical protein